MGVHVGVKGLSLSDHMDLQLISWNVRGMGNKDKRVAIRKGLRGRNLNILVLQETKMMVMLDPVVKEVWGKVSKCWLSLPSWGASGGILLMWNEDSVEVLDHEIRAFSISVRCRKINGGEEWVFSGVYGPVLLREVEEFMGEMDNVRAREMDNVRARWNLS